MRRAFLLTAVLLALTACTSSKLLQSTPAPAELADAATARGVRLVWHADVGRTDLVSERLRPSSAADRLYAAASDGTVTALAVQDGKQLWRKELDRPISGGPTVADDLVIVGTRKGEVLGLAAADGELLWISGVTSEMLAPAAIGQGVVVVRTNDGRVFALDAKTGERRWIYDRNVPVLSLRGHGSPVLVPGGVLVGFDNGRVAALSLRDGTPAWEQNIAIAQGRSELEQMVDVDADPVVVEGAVFAATYQGRIAGLSLRDGHIAWAREISVYTGIALDSNNVYASDAKGRIWAFDRFNGASVWRQDVFQGERMSGPAVYSDYVVVGGSDGYVNWLAVDDGRLVARQEVDDTRLNVTPLIAGDRIYVQSMGGRLVAYELEAGRD
ncbi:outer membrane protein assembly factor BamB [Nitrococcus mobilis]|uniref:Outer membrane protein assembly factor BamB n=1 Tax=Nitrococcus mobilis Nb-231 TaxID=314278 RepID=A4BSV6_9GAMM|nr:outer membrane protein assembly factor BamB [Nitrococcus mobilis]EAR21200.1 Pyrrolo-quinoline quinone [Nitrococcus mobilis Nb-231]